MATLKVIEHVSLDGVIQAPARPDEDPRGGFSRGGWAVARTDAVVARRLAPAPGQDAALLLGRRTYDGMVAFWPHAAADVPYAARINAQRKYVVSRTQREFSWTGAVALEGDVPEAVARLKADGQDLALLGSGELVRTLLPHGLVDEWILMLHPIVLGTGVRLFADGGPPADLELVDAVTSTTGVVIATYR